MDFSWPEETLKLVQEVEEFARTQLTSDLVANEHACHFPRENWDRCAQFGIHGWAVPEQYGGGGHDPVTTVRLLEALGYGCPDTGLTFAINSQMSSVIPAVLGFGSEDQKKKFLPRLVSGACSAFGITEENTGSDTFALEATAEPVEGGYLLNGIKKYITLAPVADFAIMFANSNPEVGRWGISAFIVQRGAEGFRTTPTQPKMGLRTTPIGDLIFENCFVPEANRLGPEGSGVSMFTSAMNVERGYVLAAQVGRMQKQLEDCIEYAKTRRQSGQPIGKFQAVSHRIADMRMRLEISRLLMYRVAWLDSEKLPLMLEAALAKLYVSEACVESGLDAIRTHGARGYLTEFEVERDLRDSIGGTIYSGTSDIQRNIVAGLLGL